MVPGYKGPHKGEDCEGGLANLVSLEAKLPKEGGRSDLVAAYTHFVETTDNLLLWTAGVVRRSIIIISPRGHRTVSRVRLYASALCQHFPTTVVVGGSRVSGGAGRIFLYPLHCTWLLV